jgi:oxygen-independent coproporphyrinogen-3 oxidase
VIATDHALLRKYNVPGPRYTSYPTVPYWDTSPTETQWLEHLGTALDSDAARHGAGAGLYVHIPFCRSMCTYCGCNMRVTRNHALVMPYVQDVLAEFAMYRSRLGMGPLRLGELHFGGGTPTFLDVAELDALCEGLLSQVTLAPGASLSVEVDPRTTSRGQLALLARHGFNRISLGVQDFDPRVQDIVNRVQSEAQVREVTETARELGFASVNYDLIYGLPLQTADSIAATMDAVLRLGPDRIAFYAYAHVPWIKPSQRRFTEADLPEGEAKRALYELGRDRLQAAGYTEIGMDHFARRGDDLLAAVHDGRLHRNFMGYTALRTEPLFGLGVSSIGDAGTAFAQNEKNLQAWESRVRQGELPLQRGHVLDAEDRVLRRHVLNVMTRMQTDWSDSADYTPFLEGVAARLAEPARDGLVELLPRGVRVPEAGRSVLRNLCMAFDARLVRKAPATQIFSSTV